MIGRSVLALIAVLAATPAVLGQRAPAESPVTAPTPAPARPVQAACTTGRSGAISEIACELALALGDVPGAPLVVAAPVGGDIKPAQPERLGARVAGVVAGALGRGARSADEPARLARARTLASRAGTLVHLELEIVRGELRVVADVYPAPKRFWSRVRDPRPSPAKHAFASRRLDAEVHTFLPAVPLVAGTIVKSNTPEQDAVALGCGDLDGHGALEIVWVGRRKIYMGRIRAGRFAPHASAGWTELSAVAQSPLREPIGSVAIEPGRHLDVGISDRANAVRFFPPFVVGAKPGRRVPWPGGGCVRFNALVLRAEIETCTPGDPEPVLARFEWATDAVAGASIATRDGKPRLVRAGRVANEALVIIKDDRGKSARLAGAGAQLAVADLDRDGQPELLSGVDTLDPKADALVVHTWQNDGQLIERLRIAIPAGVRALAVCPAESAGLLPVAVATGDGIWVVK